MEAISILENHLPKKIDISSLAGEKIREFILFRKVQEAMRNVPDFAETCKVILDAVMGEVDAENCSIMLKDPVSGELSILAARGKHEKKSVYYLTPSSDGKRFKPGEGVAGWVFNEGRAVIVNDVKEESRFVKVDGLNSNVRSLICFPIREKDQVVGVFNLSHSKKGAFDEGDKLALSYISTQVGAALTSARFFLEIQEMNRLMKDSNESFLKPSPTLPASSSTFIEVGEMMVREQGIFIYVSEKMHRIKEIIDQVANTDVTILIQGESGVGKEVVARSLHLNSIRRDKPFVKVNCAALPQELLESELFGYEKGAFTGAYRQKPGKFELANGGTIFLDEIGEISSSLQAKLLQVLQDGEFSRLGGKKDVRVDVRVLVATNKKVEKAVKEGRFREDLYYRLNVVNITIPPLRERKEEIPVFVEYFLNKFGGKYHKKVKPLPPSLTDAFQQYNWPGNVRELENFIQRFLVLGSEEDILRELISVAKHDVPMENGNNGKIKGYLSLKEINRGAVRTAEIKVIYKALEQTNWNRKKAAELLNISYKSLLNKIKECRIQQ
ncbi:MAG: GAF domain-containing protein [Deltaproteobacteria bacterium]|nr:GAF domain-containing protein [Deltaproteobacteria bacterium]